MHFSLMVMSGSLATAVLAAPIAEESKRTPAPADDLLIKVKAGDIVKKRDASPEDLDLISVRADGSVHIGRRSDHDNIKVKVGVNGGLTKRDEDDNIKVQVGAGGGLTKRDDSSEDLTTVSIGADGSVHIGRRSDDDDNIILKVGASGDLAKRGAGPDDDTRG